MVRLHVICEDGERGGRHENQFSIKSTDVSGFPGNACCSKKKKKKSYRVVPIKLVQCNFTRFLQS